ncbi:anthrone oxygenase family protein [Dyadobacter sp. LHD-138]|uniref:anthrone oxygenase family protein n=1 Tax=Dyadobacter sp. LHD-138 TaxID=3071413 RepID=UPI0027E1639A|nr:anthrone oxygenase family protein [Dyadobacter sp. LHD-138]MDQ6481296.1 DUF1772 domain-containing protein [Dyadobacter sp. LHD-138]
MMSIANFVLMMTALTTALIAGLFYAYACSVNPGLAQLADAEYIAAMKSINIAIVNPVFMFSFMGTLLLLPLSTFLQYQHGVSTRFWFLLAATLVYVIGTFGVTVAGNVPLNETLAHFDLQSASPDVIARQRADFELPWNRLHTIRTAAGIVSLVLVILACLDRSGE